MDAHCTESATYSPRFAAEWAKKWKSDVLQLYLNPQAVFNLLNTPLFLFVGKDKRIWWPERHGIDQLTGFVLVKLLTMQSGKLREIGS